MSKSNALGRDGLYYAAHAIVVGGQFHPYTPCNYSRVLFETEIFIESHDLLQVAYSS